MNEKSYRNLHEGHLITAFYQQDHAALSADQSSTEDLLDFATGEMWFTVPEEMKM